VDGREVPDGTCSQCYYVFLSKGSRVDAGVKLRKERAIAARTRMLNRLVMVLTLVLPGAGHILCGAAVRGAIFLSLATIGAGCLAFALGVLPGAEVVSPWGELPSLIICGLFLLVVWGWSLRSSFAAAADAVDGRK
jgi:hypothetical protein